MHSLKTTASDDEDEELEEWQELYAGMLEGLDPTEKRDVKETIKMEDFIDKCKFKVSGGTTRSDVHLCTTCENSIIRRGATSKSDIQFCRRLDAKIPGPIAECSAYYPVGIADIYELKAIAWDITSNKKTGKVGFISPAERRKANGQDVD